MKKIYIFLVCILFIISAMEAQLFHQQFNTVGSSISNTNSPLVNTPYASTTPNNGQFDHITSNNASNTIAFNGTNLSMTRTSGTMMLTRATDMGLAANSAIVSFDLIFSATGTSTSNGLSLYLGNGFTSTSTTTAPTVAATHSVVTFVVSTSGVPGTARFRINNNSSSTQYSCNGQRITWVTNNSGATLSYIAPDGTCETVGNDSYDFWIGTAKEINDQAVASSPLIAGTSTQTITDFAMRAPNGSSTYLIDNLLIDPIPTAVTSSAASLINSTDFTANWTAITGATGYRLDVATDAAFTSMISGYNNLYIAGSGSNSIIISGLTPSTNYFYRVRAVSQYPSAEYASCNSVTQTATTTSGTAPTITVNPSTLTSFSQTVGTPSAIQNYTISGTNLTTGITVTPPVNYEISNDGGTTWYTNAIPLSLASNGTGGVTGQPVTVQTRLNATVGGTFTGNIDHTAAGATTTNIAVTGNTVANFYNNNSGTLDLTTSWGTNPDGTGANPTSMSQNSSLFIAKNNATASFGAVTIITGTGSKLIIGDGTNPMAVTIPSGNAVTGIIDVLNQGTLICQDPTLPTLGSIMSGSTVNYDGATVAVPSANYFNLTLSNGANLAASAVANISNTFNPGTTVTATSPSTIVFNGLAAQIIPAFNYDSVAIANTIGVNTPAATATIQCNRGLKVSGAFVVAATDDVNLSSIASSMVIDATRTVTVNGRLILKSLIAPTVPTSTLTVSSGGKYVIDANVSNASGFIPAATYNAGSEILVLQGLPRLPATIGGNVVWNNPTQGGLGSFVNAATNTISGNLTITNTGTFSVNNGSGGTSRTINIGGNLIIDGGTFTPLGAPGSAATNQTVNVTGNVIVSAGALNPSAGTTGTGIGTVSIGGNLTHSGGVFGGIQTVGASVLNFNGSAAQTVSTSGFTGNTNLTINNNAGVTLTSGNIDLGTGTLTFTNGKLTLGANNITANSISGGSSTSYAVTDGTGTLKINNVGATNVTFPVGPNTSSFNPIVMNNTGSVDNFTINVTTGTVPGAVVDSSINCVWNISEDVAGGSNVTLTASWSTADQNANFNTLNCAVVHSNGTAIDYKGTGLGATVAALTSITSSGFTSFSPFGVQSEPGSALPLTLINFSAAVQANNVQLLWNTAQESNIVKYEIEKSNNGVLFNKIGETVARNGIANQYTFNDALFAGTSFYRLKIVENNGITTYSKIVAVNAKQKLSLAVFPNPTMNSLYITHVKALPNATVQVIANNGAIISKANIEATTTQSTINVALLPKGSYTLLFTNGNQAESIIFVKQ